MVDRNAEHGQDGEIPIHGVRVKGFARHGDIVKAICPFARFIETDQKFSAREPRERTAARETLQVDDKVELLGAQPADAADHLRPMRGARPAAAFEVHHVGQVGVALQEWRQTGIDPPENFGMGKMLLQQTQHGQSLDDIAKRAGFEDEDFQKFRVRGSRLRDEL